ncbi:MAG: peptidoglycan-binding protein [Granulosicoccus sp.]
MKTDNPKTHWPAPSTHDIMLVQETMQVMGLYTGNVDGVAGKETLRAVRAYKKRINLAPTNELSDEFIDHLRTQT